MNIFNVGTITKISDGMVTISFTSGVQRAVEVPVFSLSWTPKVGDRVCVSYSVTLTSVDPVKIAGSTGS